MADRGSRDGGEFPRTGDDRAATSIEKLRKAIQKVAKIAAATAPEIGAILTGEQGKPLAEAVADA